MTTGEKAAEIYCRDRATGALVPERVFGERTLRFLYEGGVRGGLARAVLRRRFASKVYGLVQASPLGRASVDRFVKETGIDPRDAEKPLAEYRSVDEFFARRLKPGARPIDEDPGHLVSPADARVLAFPALDGTLLPVKGARVTVEDLLGDAALAERYRGGSALVLRLAVADYHRFHFPDTGVASKWRELGSALDSVHPIALRSGAPSFLNKRHASELASDHFGPLLLVEVGALCVGKIVQTYFPGPVRRGVEKGYFRFGGSTIVLVASRGAVRLDEDLVKATAEGVETLVRMGTRLGCR
jgi:phosphatidylserine decarboxylase